MEQKQSKVEYYGERNGSIFQSFKKRQINDKELPSGSPRAARSLGFDGATSSLTPSFR